VLTLGINCNWGVQPTGERLVLVRWASYSLIQSFVRQSFERDRNGSEPTSDGANEPEEPWDIASRVSKGNGSLVRLDHVSLPTVGLVMIVRNEAHTLPRLAASVVDQVDCCWTIVDTGSADGTKQVALEVFGHVPGEVVDEPWKGFGESRNDALRWAEGRSDWLLMLDADETLGGRIDRTLLGDALDGVITEVRSGPFRYWLPYLIGSNRGWVWRGRTHELLALEGREARCLRDDSWWVDHHADGGSRGDKAERDLLLLGQDWEERPDDPRTAFYMAQTLEALGRLGEAVNWYRRRVAMKGWDEEVWYARYRIGTCLLASGADTNGTMELNKAWQERPWRAEPLVALSEHHRSLARWADAWEACMRAFESTSAKPDGNGTGLRADVLFIDEECYAWQVAYEASIVAWHVGERKLGKRMCDYLLGLTDLPEEIRDAVSVNRPLY
jgi:glycosyltransferase involved in cell wall biosynthesis